MSWCESEVAISRAGILIRAATFFGLISLSADWLSACSRHVISVTVCDLVGHPDKYNGKLVQVEAAVESDGIERTVLTDEACPTSGVAPSFPAKIRGEQHVILLQQAIFAGQPGTMGKRISATFVGTFDIRPHDVPRWVLHVKAVLDVQSQSTSE